jgi:hypothetical protein
MPSNNMDAPKAVAANASHQAASCQKVKIDLPLRIRSGENSWSLVDGTSELHLPKGDKPEASFESRSRANKYRELAKQNLGRNKIVTAQRCLVKAMYLAMIIDHTEHLATASDLEDLADWAFKAGEHDIAKSLMMRAKQIKSTI